MSDAATDTVVVPINAAVAQPAQEKTASENVSAQDAASALTSGRSAPHPADAPLSSDLQLKPANAVFQLKDIQVGKTDGRGLKITQVYAVQTDDYAIYRACDVMVQFADDPVKAQAMKKSILPISSTRAEINSLLDGLGCREVGDRQLAYALQLALDGDLDGAKATAETLKTALVAKRAARGRFQVP